MTKFFCQSCGGDNSYAVKKPNFCSHCGGVFGVPAKAKLPEKAPSRRPIPEDYLEEEYETNIDFDNLTPLNPEDVINVEALKSGNQFSFQELYSAKQQPQPKRKRPPSSLKELQKRVKSSAPIEIK